MWEPETIKYKIGGEGCVNFYYHKLTIVGAPCKSGSYNIVVSGYTLGQ
jgi:hypothetical protein